MSLFDNQTFDFFCNRIGKTEEKQILLWSKAKFEEKINQTDDAQKKHLLQIVAYQVLESLRFILSKSKETDEKFAEQNLFVQQYVSLLHVDQDKESSKESREAAKEKLKNKILLRRDTRNDFFKQLLKVDTTKDFDLKFVQIADWYENQNLQSSVAFDVIVNTFIESMSQKMLEKSLSNLIFPVITLQQKTE